MTAESKSNSQVLLNADEYQRDDAVLLLRQALLSVADREFHSPRLQAKTKEREREREKHNFIFIKIYIYIYIYKYPTKEEKIGPLAALFLRFS